jgi:hypothetical protein
MKKYTIAITDEAGVVRTFTSEACDEIDKLVLVSQYEVVEVLGPVAAFTSVCTVRADGIGADCALDGSSSTGAPVSYAWTATGKTPKTGAKVTYPFKVGATPTVTLTVTDAAGKTNTATKTITVP